MINHYIYSKKNNLKFILNTEQWMFKSVKGWEDYFEPLENKVLQYGEIPKEYIFGKIIEDYSIEEYKNAIKDIYILNTNTKNRVMEVKYKFGLIDGKYDSIFIRRGDKLLGESKVYNTQKYIELLLLKNPFCNTIFLQTDDYNCFLDIKKYIEQYNLKIQVFTLCEQHIKGVFVYNHHNISTNIQKNVDYVNLIKKEINYKSVNQMNSSEIYNHTVDMVVGIDILKTSENCVLDYQSNVSRFIKLTHNNPNNVFDIEGFDLDLTKKICPSFSESVYDDPNTWRHS